MRGKAKRGGGEGGERDGWVGQEAKGEKGKDGKGGMKTSLEGQKGRIGGSDSGFDRGGR